MRQAPPKKQKGQATGRRSLTGALLDIGTLAEELGDTEGGIRGKVARGLLPYRRQSGRIIFLREEIFEFLSKLPGVTVEQALANVAARRNGSAPGGNDL